MSNNISDIIGDFRHSEVPKTSDPLPPGFYDVEVKEAEVRDTKANDGKYVYVVCEVTKGDYDGRKAFLRFNIKNKNPLAQSIGQGQLAEVCEACGIPVIRDTSQLLGCSFQLKLKVVEDRNDYAGCKKTETVARPTSAPPSAPPAATPAAPATTPERKKMPWER